MTLQDPRAYPSREQMWLRHFTRRRLSELAPLVTETILQELARNPKGLEGDQSDALSQILNFLRNETPMRGRAFVYVQAPGRAYRLARLRGRGVPPDLEGPSFETEAAAVVAVMIDRLRTFGLLADETAAP